MIDNLVSLSSSHDCSPRRSADTDDELSQLRAILLHRQTYFALS